MNALKHGLTAKTVLLPEEHPAEFQELLVGWFDSIEPQDRLEASLVERGVYSLWQLDRANRSEAARLWLNADGHADDQEKQVRKDVAGSSAEAASCALRAAGGVFVRWENGRRS